MDVGKREDLFFGLHSIIEGKLDFGKREDLFFFGLHSIIEGKLDVGKREEIFFWSSPDRGDIGRRKA